MSNTKPKKKLKARRQAAKVKRSKLHKFGSAEAERQRNDPDNNWRRSGLPF